MLVGFFLFVMVVLFLAVGPSRNDQTRYNSGWPGARSSGFGWFGNDHSAMPFIAVPNPAYRRGGDFGCFWLLFLIFGLLGFSAFAIWKSPWRNTALEFLTDKKAAPNNTETVVKKRPIDTFSTHPNLPLPIEKPRQADPEISPHEYDSGPPDRQPVPVRPTGKTVWLVSLTDFLELENAELLAENLLGLWPVKVVRNNKSGRFMVCLLTENEEEARAKLDEIRQKKSILRRFDLHPELVQVIFE